MPRIFVSQPLPGNAVERLRKAAEVSVGEVGVGVDGLGAEAAELDGILTLLTDRVGVALLDRLPRLRVVANMAVGYDNIEVEACRQRGVLVTNTPDVLTEATADMAFALLLAAARRVAEGDRYVRAGHFDRWRPDVMIGRRVHGGVLGIVGLGRIGQAVARRARGFGMHVLYAQRRQAAPPVEQALRARHVDLTELFAACDFVSLHCPLTDATRGLVSAERLASMKPGAVLVNTARGACVDEEALVTALRHGPLAAAGLDVFAGEVSREFQLPPELLALPNVVLTPHVASAELPTREAMAGLAADNLLAFLRGETPPNAV